MLTRWRGRHPSKPPRPFGHTSNPPLLSLWHSVPITLVHLNASELAAFLRTPYGRHEPSNNPPSAHIIVYVSAAYLSLVDHLHKFPTSRAHLLGRRSRVQSPASSGDLRFLPTYSRLAGDVRAWVSRVGPFSPSRAAHLRSPSPCVQLLPGRLVPTTGGPCAYFSSYPAPGRSTSLVSPRRQRPSLCNANQDPSF
jgi:hypothetical protein